VHLIRATSLIQFPELVAELGGNPANLLRPAGIRVEDIGHFETFIVLRGAIAALEAAATATSTPDIGRRLSCRQGIEILGPVGVAARNAGTFGEALTTFNRFMAAYSPGLSVAVHPLPDPEIVFFEHRIELSPTPPHGQTVELSLGIMLRVLRMLLQPDYAPVEVHLPHRPLAPESDYRRFFGTRVLFGRPAAGLVIRSDDLERELRCDTLTHETATSYLQTIVSQRPPTTARAVADMARHLLPARMASIEMIAEQFGLHPKALQRRLATEGTSFSSVIDGLRREMAEQYLRDPAITLVHLSHQLGFAEQSVLSRAAHRWFGMSPMQYRRQQGQSARS